MIGAQGTQSCFPVQTSMDGKRTLTRSRQSGTTLSHPVGEGRVRAKLSTLVPRPSTQASAKGRVVHFVVQLNRSLYVASGNWISVR